MSILSIGKGNNTFYRIHKTRKWTSICVTKYSIEDS